MTIREFFESKDKLAIHCDTAGKAKRLLEAFDKAGYRWRSGLGYKEFTTWRVYKKDTCYTNKKGYGDINYCKDKGWQILEFEEIELEIERT